MYVNFDVIFLNFFFEVVDYWGFSRSTEFWRDCLIGEEDVFFEQRACFFNSSVSRRGEI